MENISKDIMREKLIEIVGDPKEVSIVSISNMMDQLVGVLCETYNLPGKSILQLGYLFIRRATKLLKEEIQCNNRIEKKKKKNM